MTVKVAIITHSLSGGSLFLARAINEGVTDAIADAEVRLLRVPELKSDEEMAADQWFGSAWNEKVRPIPVASIDDLRWADAIVVGGGTRFGGPSAALRNFLEQAGPLWFSGALVDKVGASFVTSSTPHGGVELSALSLLASLSHLGMILVTPGYVDPASHEGGSPYGAVGRAGGRKNLQPTEHDLGAAKSLGRRVATVAREVRSLRAEQPVGAGAWSG